VVSLTSSSGGYINGRNSANLELLIDKTSSIYLYVERLKSNPKPCKYFSKQYMLNVKMVPLNIQSKWEKEVHMGVVIENYNWRCIYCIPFSVTKDTKLQDFQYKLIHRILITNSFLYKYELKDTEQCTFCTETKENLVHIFWDCNYVRNFWLSIGNFLKICGMEG
jgi:hypothetical protein